MSTFLATLAVFLLFVLFAAIGVLFGRRALQGSCGGLGRFGISCDGGCSRRCPSKAAAQEEKERSC
ncbi:MAG: (Na+)-NQR maturation NqrM [Hydrogenophilus sp.]